jgi:addiction module HigA family antidote
MKAEKLKTDYIATPGEVMKSYIDGFNMTKEELVAKTGIELETIHNLLNDTEEITEEVAQSLCKAFGRPVDFWTNMKKTYLREKKEIEERTGKKL